MALRTVGEVAQLLGISVRTLHYWEERGLVQPSERTWSEYRLYSDADIRRLQQIMLYRATGMRLDDIAQALAQHTDPVVHLQRQKALLMQRQSELATMVQALDQLLEDAMEEQKLSVDDIAAILGEVNLPAYQEEAAEKWGQDETWQQAQQTQQRMAAQDWQDFHGRMTQLEASLQRAFQEGTAPESAAAQELAEQHRVVMGQFYTLTHARQVLLARSYEADSRFRAHYEALAPGLTAWLVQAIENNAVAHGVDLANVSWEQ